MTAGPPDRSALGLSATGTAICLVLAFLVERPGQGFAAAAATAALAMAAGVLGRGRIANLLLRGGAILAAMLAAFPAASSGAAFWPGALAAAFASRVLAEDNEMRLGLLWCGMGEPGTVQAQSAASAASLAIAFGLLAAWAAPLLPAHGGGQAGDLLLAALRSGTALHLAVIGAFALVLGFLADAVLLHARDRAAWREALTAAGADKAFAALPPSSQARLAPGLERLGALPSPHRSKAAAAKTLADGTRRFLRALLALLPLLGFLGTVVGLSAAIGALPGGATGQAAGRIDLVSAVAGLAIKFETTLLGLGGAFLAALALGWLERAEAAFLARAALGLGRAEAGWA
jgi:hypothetical protein